MKKLQSIALYTLLTPAIMLSSGLALAQQPAAQDIDQEQQRSQQQRQGTQSTTGASQSTGTPQSATGASQGDHNTMRTQQSGTQTATDRQHASGQSRTENRGFMNSAPANGMHASNLIGADVKNSGDDDVGSVTDLIIDHEGQVVAVIVGVGGFLGMGERDVAIGWDDVTRSGTSDDNELRITSNRDVLRSAPAFRKQADPRQQGAAQSTPRAAQSTAASGQSASGAAQSTDRTPPLSATGASQTATAGSNANGLNRMESRGFMESSPTNGMHASNLMGADVTTSGGDDVGSVSDLIIDREGQVVAIIIGVGGFLGIGQRDVAIGWDDVNRSTTSGDYDLRVNVSSSDLRSAPEFKKLD